MQQKKKDSFGAKISILKETLKESTGPSDSEKKAEPKQVEDKKALDQKKSEKKPENEKATPAKEDKK